MKKCEFVWYLVNVSLTAQTILFNRIKNSSNHAQTVQKVDKPSQFIYNSITMRDDDYQYNNEEEAEMAQLHSIHLHLNAISDVQRKLARQRERASLEHCEECGDEIPQQRREAIPGVELCVFCQELNETRFGR